nr:zinc finger protein 488 [Oryctolagus cuniculus]XP_051693526.1 zinc finger protein 488 [Oryctolagus cuniculus]
MEFLAPDFGLAQPWLLALRPVGPAQLSQGPLGPHGPSLHQIGGNPKALHTDGARASAGSGRPRPCLLIGLAAGKAAALSPPRESRVRLSEPEQDRGNGLRSALLEKTNHRGPQAAAGGDVVSAEPAMRAAADRPNQGQPPGRLGREKPREASAGPPMLTPGVPRAPGCSTARPAWLSGARGEQRSAFSKPSRRPVDALPVGGSAEELSGLTRAAPLACWPAASHSTQGELLWALGTWPQGAALCGALRGAPALWPPAPATCSAASRALLPPTLSSLGLSAQNRCARCSVAFRLTADLVVHMRSHHKRAPAKKRREDALTCPFCQEHFRERHHLSRHMTSHS